MDGLQRLGVINQMGADVTMLNTHAAREEWPLARMYLTRLTGAIGLLAMEIDEHDPVEQ